MAPPHQKSNGRSMFTNKPPHFFKIILQKTLQDGKLEIPKMFISKYGNGMSSPAILKVPTGQVWKVELRKHDGKVWLNNGWREFSNHFSLKNGHFLVFRYQSNCNFHVIIMDRTATEIDYPCTSDNDEHLQEIPDESESEDDDHIEIIEEIPPAPGTKFPCPRPRKRMISTDSQAMHNGVPAMTKKLKAGEQNDTSECRKRKDKSATPCPQPHKKMKFDSPNTSGTRINLKSKAKGRGVAASKGPEIKVPKSRCLKPAEKTEALKKASGFRSKNPFFMVVMQPSCLSSGGRVSIPVSFARDYIKTRKGTLILCSSNGQTRSVRYYFMKRKNGFQPLLRGLNWEAFAKDNALEVGDACVFELTEMRPQIMLKVSIYPIDANAARSNEAEDDVSIEILEEAASRRNLRNRSPSHGKKTRGIKLEKLKGSTSSNSFKQGDGFMACKRTGRGMGIEQKSPEQAVILEFSKLTAKEQATTLHIANSFNSKNPFFVAVIRPLKIRKYMFIPSNFALKFFTKTPVGGSSRAILRLSNGKSWPVTYVCRAYRRNPKTYFQAGWKKFALDNHLAVDDICVCELLKGAEITLKVAIIRAADVAHFDTLQAPKFPKRRSWRASEAAGSRNHSNIPFFIKEVTPSYLDRTRCRLHIPFEFVDKHLMVDAKNVILQVADRVWSAKLVVNKLQRVVYIGAGWLKFASEICLTVGDICIFKLIASSNGDPMLNVSIARRDD